MDFGPSLQPLIAVVLYLIPLAIVVGIIKTPWFKGKAGEFLVNLSARLFLDRSRYHLIKNVTLPTEDGTTQIDHVLISEFGVFVVETKNMKGWIFGSARQPFWTQKIFRSNYKFQNPLHQNYKHVKTLQALLGLVDHQMHSVVVFVGGSTFKTPMPENVSQGLGYVRYIKSKTEPVLSAEQVAERSGAPVRRARRGGVFRLLAWSVMVVIIGLIMANAYSSFSSFRPLKVAPSPVESTPKPILRQPNASSNTARSAQGKTNTDMAISRTAQPPSELMLARQECNSLIAEALGNQDPRLLRSRDKACARYKILQGEPH